MDIYFDGFCFKPDEKCLFRAGERTRLTVKETLLLAILLERPGKTVPKQELMRRLWPDAEMDEANLFQHVRSLRKKFRTSGSDRLYFENIPGNGYRFLVDVNVEEAAIESPPPAYFAGTPLSNAPPELIAQAFWATRLSVAARESRRLTCSRDSR